MYLTWSQWAVFISNILPASKQKSAITIIQDYSHPEIIYSKSLDLLKFQYSVKNHRIILKLLTYLQSEKCKDFFIASLNNSNPKIRIDALRAYGDSVPFNILSSSLYDSDNYIQIYSAKKIGSLADKNALNDLRDVLEKTSSPRGDLD